MRQAPQAIDLIAETFALTGGEARMLLAAGRGEALLLAGSHRVAFTTVASAREHQLCAGLADLIADPDLLVVAQNGITGESTPPILASGSAADAAHPAANSGRATTIDSYRQ